jgi:2-polyprenyl-6-methoxyphenol hydroxylase-like FAD-dependent oxidoreductase
MVYIQGVNSALEDALVFDQCLTKHSDSLAPALADYQAQRLPDTKALIRLQVAHYICTHIHTYN